MQLKKDQQVKGILGIKKILGAPSNTYQYLG